MIRPRPGANRIAARHPAPARGRGAGRAPSRPGQDAGVHGVAPRHDRAGNSNAASARSSP